MEKKTDFKALTPKAKVGYIWDYYRWYIVGAICVIAFLGSLIHHYATYKESVLDIMMVNTTLPYIEDISGFDEFFELEGLDASSQEINVDTSNTYNLTDTASSTNYYTDEAVSISFAVGDLDLFFAPEVFFESFGASGCLTDLSTVLTPEEMDAYADILVYATDPETNITIPCGVLLTDNTWITKNQYYEDACCFGIAINTDAPDLSVAFFRYLMSFETSVE